ncbi:MAG: catalase [Eggerthellaceae bacterium]|nr:catalase [Eggerthellaceae bacterium]
MNAHRREVRRLCFAVGLYKQGLIHDLSKYSPSEFWAGVKYFQGYRSPNALERDLYGYSVAWLHHKGRNKHHFEYWVDVNTEEKFDYAESYVGAPMPTRYLIEMFFDRIAASKVYQKENYTDASALEYFERECLRHYVPMHDKTKRVLVELLHMLADNGEEYVLSYIRQTYVSQKNGYGEGIGF